MNQLTDLLEDLEFIRWVKYPDSELTTFWKSWMEANPNRIEDVKLAKEIILGLQFPSQKASEETKKEVLTRILRVNKKEPRSYHIPNISEENRRTWYFPRVAAILIGILSLALVLVTLKKETSDETAFTATKWITKRTNTGEKMSFRLPDRTVVWLNSSSSLSYPESFDSTVRLVKLRGEGFFEVSENVQQPFQVWSDSLITTALGTSFNINAKNSDELKVSLLTGKVAINHQSDSLNYLLIPGEELNYKKSSKQAEVQGFNDEHVLGWRFGKLVFKNSSLKEVQESLEEWYGVEIAFSGTARSGWRFNGKFENQTLENVLKSMSNIENFTYTIDNKKVLIVFNQ